jgi:hypothetical protein
MWRLLSALPALMGLLVCLASDPVRGGDAAALAELIDRHIQARLDAEGLTRAPLADDAEFLRRVHLDLHGVVPAADETAKFLASRDPQKRAQRIDELLASPRFGEHFADLWRGRLLSPLANEQRLQTDRFAAWLANRLNDNDGWDRVTRDLLTATGKLDENPAVTWLIEGRHPLGVSDLADLSSRYFLGFRLNCAQCHDHPFVQWKRQDYWGLAAFFAQIQTPGRPKVVYQAGLRDDPKMTLATLKHADASKAAGGIADVRERPRGRAGDERSRASHSPSGSPPENPYFAGHRQPPVVAFLRPGDRQSGG